MVVSATKTMRANRSTDSSIEVAVRKALWASGIRGYRKNVKSLPGKPDIVFRRQKLVVDIRGCFWHQCPTCTGKVPNSNSDYWKPKMARTVDRDQRNKEHLEGLGYQVLVFWEHEINEDLNGVVNLIQDALFARAQNVSGLVKTTTVNVRPSQRHTTSGANLSQNPPPAIKHFTSGDRKASSDKGEEASIKKNAVAQYRTRCMKNVMCG